MRPETALGTVMPFVEQVGEMKNAILIKRETVADVIIIRRSPILHGFAGNTAVGSLTQIRFFGTAAQCNDFITA